MTREELDAVRNHISNLPTVGAMYAPVLVEWVSVLLRQRDEITAQRDSLLDASKEGAWMARALDAERERDEAREAQDNLRKELAQQRDDVRTEVERMRERIATQEDGLRHGEQVCARLLAARDAKDHALRRVLTGVINDAIRAKKAKAMTTAAEHGRSSRQHRTAVARLDELRDAHNTLQSLQVGFSHAWMLLGGWVRACDKEDAYDIAFHLRLAREYFEVRE